MLMRCLAAALTALALAAAPACADPKQTAEAVDKAVAEWMKQKGVASAELAVGFQGNQVGAYGHGWKPTEPHLLASLSKAITAVCVAELIDQGKLKFIDTVGAVLAKDLEVTGEPIDPRFKGLSIRQLLTHRAGIEKNTFGNATTMEGAFKTTVQTKLRDDVNFFYSDSGYMVLGMVAQRVTGQPYADTCRKVLTETGASGTIEPSLAERAPNGAWVMSAVDYLKFLSFFDANSGRLKLTKAFLRTPPGGNYSFGAFVKMTAAGVTLSHTGLVHQKGPHPLSGGSYYIVNPAGWTVVVIFSGENPDAVYNALAAAIDKALAGEEAPAKPGASEGGLLTAKINGADWSSDDVISTYTNFGGHPVFNLSARAYKKPTQFFTMNLFLQAGADPKGTQAFDRTKPLTASNGNYTANPDPIEIMENSYPFQNGQVTITTYDPVHKTIAGTFQASAKNHTGKALTITGQFKNVEYDPAKLK